MPAWQRPDRPHLSRALQHGGPGPPDPLPGEDVPGLPRLRQVAHGEAGHQGGGGALQQPPAAGAALLVLGLDAGATVGDQLGADLSDLLRRQVGREVPGGGGNRTLFRMMVSGLL